MFPITGKQKRMVCSDSISGLAVPPSPHSRFYPYAFYVENALWFRKG